jgi:undecaprenyl-diphosphatase
MKSIAAIVYISIVITTFWMTAAAAGSQDGIDESSPDVKIFRALNGSAANPVLDRLMPIVTDFRRTRVWLLLVWSALVIFGGQRGRWAAFMLIPLVAASDQISSQLIKPLVGRMRPCEVLGGVHLWHGKEGWLTTPAEVVRSYKGSFSFPSSHAANITASMLFLGLVYRRWIGALLTLAALVSYSRIYIGVHWPSDAAAGMIIGGLLAWPAYLVFVRIAGGKGEGEAGGRGDASGMDDAGVMDGASAPHETDAADAD